MVRTDGIGEGRWEHEKVIQEFLMEETEGERDVSKFDLTIGIMSVR